MKKIRPFFIALLLNCQLYAADSSRMNRIYLFLKDSAEDRMCIGCGYAGTTSWNVLLFSELVDAKRYDLIQDLMFSDIAVVQYMSAYTTQYLQRKKRLIPDSSHAKRLTELQNSKEVIYLRSGCTGHEWDALGTLLDPKNRKSTINQSFKRYIK